MTLDQPRFVVLSPELAQRLDQLRDGGKRSDPKQVFLQCGDDAFCHSVSFGLEDEAQGAGPNQKVHLYLKVVTHIGTAVIVADSHPRRNPLVEAAEVLSHALVERLQRLQAVARLCGVDADALPRTVV